MKIGNVDTLGAEGSASLEIIIHNVKYTIVEDKEKGFMLLRNSPTTLVIRPLTTTSVKIE